MTIMCIGILPFANNGNLLHIAYETIGFISLICYLILLLFLRYYLLNFKLKRVRNIILLLVIFMIIFYFVLRYWFFLLPSEYTSTIMDYNTFRNFIYFTLSSFHDAFIWACYLIIGISIYRFKEDFVGGLSYLGKSFIVVVALSFIKEVGYVIVDVIESNSIVFYKLLISISHIIHLYLYYAIYATFSKARQYNNQIENKV